MIGQSRKVPWTRHLRPSYRWQKAPPAAPAPPSRGRGWHGRCIGFYRVRRAVWPDLILRTPNGFGPAIVAGRGAARRVRCATTGECVMLTTLAASSALLAQLPGGLI